MLFAAPARPDTSPVISEFPWKPLSVQQQAFLQSNDNDSASVAHPSRSSGMQTVGLASEGLGAAVPFLQPAQKAGGQQRLLLEAEHGEGPCGALRSPGSEVHPAS